MASVYGTQTYANLVNPYAFDRAQIDAAYQQYLGRSAGEADYAAHARNPGGTMGVIDAVKNSDEARQYAANLAKANTATGTTGAGYTGGAGTFAVSGDKARGGTGAEGWAYTGFDFAQDPANRSIDKHAKYAFAEATRQAKEAGVSDIWKTKAGAQYFAEQYVKPFLESSGFKVGDIVGDKMQVTSPEGTYWIDFVVNAGGDNPALAWQAEQAQTAWSDFGTKWDTSAFGATPTGTGTTDTPTDATGQGTTDWLQGENAMNEDAYAELYGNPNRRYLDSLIY